MKVRALATVTHLDPLVVTPALVLVVSVVLELVVLDLVSALAALVPVSVAVPVVSEVLVPAVALELVASEVLLPVNTSPPTLEAVAPDQETSTLRLDTDTKMDILVMVHGGDDCANVEQKIFKSLMKLIII